MPQAASFDIELGGDNYVLARDSSGVPQLRLGSMPSEPGQKSVIDSIVIPSFHGGFGQLMSVDPTRYFWNEGLMTLAEGVIWPVGAAVENESADLSNGVVSGISQGGIVLTSNAAGSDVKFYISPGAIATAAAEVRRPQASHYFTGSWAQHGDYIYFGRANSSTHVSVAAARYQVSAATWDDTVSGTTYSGPVASYFAVYGNRLWYVANAASGTAPSIYWNDHATLDAGSLRGPFTPLSAVRITGLAIISGYALYMASNKTINAIDSAGVFAPVVSDPYMHGGSLTFGLGARMWMGRLMVPHDQGLLMIEPDLSAYTEVSPLSMAMPSTQATGLAYAAPTGPGVVACAKNHIWYSDGRNIWQGKWGKDGLKWHPFPAPSAGTTIIGLELVASSNVAWAIDYIILNSTVYEVYTATMAHPDGIASSILMGAAEAAITTSIYPGEGLAGMVTKRFIRVRGNATLQSTNQATITVYFRTDNESAFTSAGTFSTANGGFFSIALPTTSASLGRGIQLKISINLADISTPYEHINMPLYIDYEYVPSENDYVRLPIVASPAPIGKRSVKTRRTQTRETIVAAIQSLIGTITTLKMDENNTSWTVIVEDYNAAEIDDNIVLNSGEAVVEVLCRRIA